MTTIVLKEAGYKEAMLGLSLSYGQSWTPDDELKAYEVALRLTHKGGGHNKFLESICVWLDVTAPRFFWSEMDTYRVGMTKQSESTMHTLKRDGVKDSQFEPFPGHLAVSAVRDAIYYGESIDEVKARLPESFLQRRILCTNYATLQRIVKQRAIHKLPQWREFCQDVVKQIKYPDLLRKSIQYPKHDELEAALD